MISNAVRIAQQRLLAYGFDLGPSGVDGIKGDHTTKALQAFQKKQGLTVSGKIDSATLDALLKTPPQPKPNMRPEPDKLGTGNTDATPRLRPPPDQLGSGNTNTMPRMRPSAEPTPTPVKLGVDGDPAMWMPTGKVGAGAYLNGVVQRQGGEPPTRSTPQIASDGNPLGWMPSGKVALGSMRNGTAYRNQRDFPDIPLGMPPAMQPGGQQPPQPPPAPQGPYAGNPPPGSQLTAMADQAGSVLGGQGAGQPATEDAAKQQLQMMLWKMLLGARIQPQQGQPAKSDLYAEPPPAPPPFTSPTGTYR